MGGGFLPLDKMYSDADFGTASLKSLKQLNASVYEVEIEATDVVPFGKYRCYNDKKNLWTEKELQLICRKNIFSP